MDTIRANKKIPGIIKHIFAYMNDMSLILSKGKILPIERSEIEVPHQVVLRHICRIIIIIVIISSDIDYKPNYIESRNSSEKRN